MTRKNRIGTRLALCAALALAGGPALAQRILIVDLDDLGAELVAACDTPTLDRLAKEGRTFRNFYTAPICSPTRQRFNLGAFSSHPDVLLGRTVAPDGDFSMPLEPLEPLAAVVAKAGHSTAKIGKWHLCRSGDTRHPNRAGWQHYAGVLNNAGAHKGYVYFHKVTNGETEVVAGEYLTTVETDDAIASVRAGVELISLSYHAIHTPYHVPPAPQYAGPKPDTDLEKARAMLDVLDFELGRLIDAALEAGYTVLVFSDNGTSESIGGDKRTVWERVVRMPFWAIGAGVEPGIDDSLVAVEDLYATVLAMFEIPGGPTRGPDSVSFAPRLAGEDNPDAREWLYTEVWGPNGLDPRSPERKRLWQRAIRGERYKIVRDLDIRGDRFFDIQDDPGEQNDLLAQELADEHRAAYERLKTQLEGIR